MGDGVGTASAGGAGGVVSWGSAGAAGAELGWSCGASAGTTEDTGSCLSEIACLSLHGNSCGCRILRIR